MIGLALQMWLWWAQPAGPTGPALTFDVHTSAGADPAAALPTVVILHGRDDALYGLPRALRNSKRPLRIVVPWGPRTQRDGTHAWFRRAEAHTADGQADEVTSAARRVVELLEGLQSSGLVLGRPVLVGYSQGAVVALQVSLEAPDAVGEVVAIAGHLPPAHVPDTLADHAITHVLIGEKDRVMSAKVSHQQVEHLQGLGFVVDAVAFPDHGHGMWPRMRRTALRRIHAALRVQAEA